MKIVSTRSRTAEKLLQQLEQRGAVTTARVEPVVRAIMNAVRKRGDRALLQYARKFDWSEAKQPLLVTRAEMKAAWKATSPELQTAMLIAAKNIRDFAEAQKPQEWTRSPSPGVKTGQIVRPLESVGCYVPGGRYPLPSTLFMTAIPASVAGVERIVVCSPKPAKETMAAAYLAGVTEFYRIGGAQAIAALAYGTETIQPVNKIVGPGNLYVTAAKVIASAVCGIDMPAGPTEIVVTSEKGSAAGIAADLVAQAEHDPETLAVLVTSKPKLAAAVAAEVKAAREDESAREDIHRGARRHLRHEECCRGARNHQPPRARAPHRRRRERSGLGQERRLRLRRRLRAAVHGRLHLRHRTTCCPPAAWAACAAA